VPGTPSRSLRRAEDAAVVDRSPPAADHRPRLGCASRFWSSGCSASRSRSGSRATSIRSRYSARHGMERRALLLRGQGVPIRTSSSGTAFRSRKGGTDDLPLRLPTADLRSTRRTHRRGRLRAMRRPRRGARTRWEMAEEAAREAARVRAHRLADGETPGSPSSMTRGARSAGRDPPESAIDALRGEPGARYGAHESIEKRDESPRRRLLDSHRRGTPARRSRGAPPSDRDISAKGGSSNSDPLLRMITTGDGAPDVRTAAMSYSGEAYSSPPRA